MLQGYLEQGMEETAVFECFVRTMPPERGFFIAAGLAQLLEFLENVRFTPDELEWVANSGRFSRSFVEYLERFRFAGDLHAMPEGTVFFANEPGSASKSFPSRSGPSPSPQQKAYVLHPYPTSSRASTTRARSRKAKDICTGMVAPWRHRRISSDNVASSTIACSRI